MRNPRRKLLLLALVALILALAAQMSVAYFSTTGTATNVVTSGGIRLTIHEVTDGGKPFPKNGVKVIPGDVVHKEVFVENSFDHPFWLRVRLVWGDDSERLDAESALQITDLNDSEWILHSDGYYYYHRILEPREFTEPLFKEVHLVGDLVDQHDIGTALTITVKAEAVQSEHNPAQYPWDASGWPEV